MVFCIVSHHGDAIRPLPTATDGVPCLVDQVSIDIPAADYGAECAFWSALTSWPLHASARPEFSYLTRPAAMPLRLLLQRLGDDDSGARARAHLDLACGPDLGALTTAHERQGAVVRRRTPYWMTLVDPAGLEYCLTMRDPITGTLA